MLVTAGLLLVYPNPVADVAGFLLVAVVVALQVLVRGTRQRAG